VNKKKLKTSFGLAHPPEERNSTLKFQWFQPILLVLLIGVMGILAWKSDLQDWTDPILIAGLLEEWGSLAPLVFMLVMAGAVVISPIPSVPLDAAAGAFFGPFLGTGYSVLGAEAGALISFFITRTLGKKAVTRWLKSDIGFCEKCSERNLFIVILCARLLPVFSFDLVSYGAGLTGFCHCNILGNDSPYPRFQLFRECNFLWFWLYPFPGRFNGGSGATRSAMVKAVQSMGTVFASGKTYTVGLISFSIKIVRSDLPPKNGPEYMLGFGPKT